MADKQIILRPAALTDADYQDAAGKLGCEVKVIKAVATVESSGAGFFKNGDIKILFEPHIFWQQLKARGKDPAAILKAQPELQHVLYQRWKTFPYGPPSTQWDRLRLALQVDLDAAYYATSWGKFQIMGFNHKAAGFPTIINMTHDFYAGERAHLQAFVNLIIGMGLKRALQVKNWAVIARTWNGPGYRQYTSEVFDDYDYKLQRVYARLK